MTRGEIFEGLKDILSKVKPNINLEEITPESSLNTDLGVDSLSMLLLSLACEDKFSMRFESQSSFSSVNDVIDYIESAIK